MFKLDPDKTISDAALKQLCLSGTDGIIVGGSSGVTFDNTASLLTRIRQYASLPCALEISNRDAVVPTFDYFFIPMVLNTTQIEWLIGQQLEAIKDYGQYIDWNTVIPEGYIILNEQSTAAQLTGALTDLSEHEILAYVTLIDQMMKLPICYIEYSGTYGDMTLLQRIAAQISHSKLFYGGGINSSEKANQARQFADTIVVGNVIYEDLQAALATVQ